MLNALLKRFNQHRKEKYFQSPLFHAQKEYAFVGFGVHSMTSLYPVLRHYNLRLKYICTRGSDWQRQLGPLFPGCRFTHDLDTVIADTSVAGVFVCAAPEAHYEILSALLKAGKPVFIEKPPCRTLGQLRELAAIAPAAVCKLGLQRRHWPGNTAVRKKCRLATDYIYRFQTGPYPQGDPFTELFIHALDYAGFLFGPAQLLSCCRQQDKRGITVQLHLGHAGGASGLLHLSTRYTWNPPLECLTVSAGNESLDIRYPVSVTGTQMPLRILHAPAERLTGQRGAVKEYFSGVPTMVPALETNTLYTQGFLPEIEDFVTRIERPASASGESNDLLSLLTVYELIDKIGEAS
ncbi:MAG TPA: Gfo/Idh/MocA family oxidoreductase [Puia sp.]|nr:Gfo/Idh/MocA family oxidoreductase [Puia sp.]